MTERQINCKQRKVSLKYYFELHLYECFCNKKRQKKTYKNVKKRVLQLCSVDLTTSAATRAQRGQKRIGMPASSNSI